MNEIYVANFYNLKIGDRILRPKGLIFKHHGIYVGIHNGIPLVAENQVGVGVRCVTLSGFLHGNISNIVGIERFNKSEDMRRKIIPRIEKLLGTQYDLVNFNCEHFAEFIQHGKPKSQQVKNAFIGLGAMALIGIFASAKR